MPGMRDPMNHDPKEIKISLKSLLGDETPAPAKAVIREALQLIATMQADLRRQGFTEYDDKDTDND